LENSGRLIIVSEVYFPDEQGTAYYISKLADGLAKDYAITVLCGYPTVTARGNQVLEKETLNDVSIERCRGTTFNKDNLLLRLVNLSTLSVRVFLRLFRVLRGNDVVIVVNGPHPLPYLTRVVCFFRRAKCILRIDDVYPEALVATGVLSEKSMAARFLGSLNTLLYRGVDRLVVLGRDMQALAGKRTRNGADHIRIIHNWGDVDTVFPKSKATNPLLNELGLQDRFVVSCAGNMGRAQAIEVMFDAITQLRTNDAIHFLFVGSGAKRPWMEKQIKERSLPNVTLLDQRPRIDQENFLNACDIAMASLMPGMAGAGVPSRMYNIMAAGKPIIAIAEPDSELSLVVQEEQIGWVVAPDDPERLAEVILEAYSDKETLQFMGKRARKAAEQKYSREKIIQDYREFIKLLFETGGTSN
jgi:colanic acid biosynthesis glycosyl transferase WcaI